MNVPAKREEVINIRNLERVGWVYGDGKLLKCVALDLWTDSAVVLSAEQVSETIEYSLVIRSG